ncbi:MAG: hypothetical protein K0S45_3432 [Nitrospira sp.]|jgi:putative transposase|nr:hypothetical protein [Nitrospira sp.]
MSDIAVFIIKVMLVAELLPCQQSRALEDWAYRRGVQLDFIRPGKPVENTFIESFHGRLRGECLSVHQFASLADAQAFIEV